MSLTPERRAALRRALEIKPEYSPLLPEIVALLSALEAAERERNEAIASLYTIERFYTEVAINAVGKWEQARRALAAFVPDGVIPEIPCICSGMVPPTHHPDCPAYQHWDATPTNLLHITRLAGIRAGLEAAAKHADNESHKPGAQGFSGEPRHTDFHVFADHIRRLDPEAIARETTK